MSRTIKSEKLFTFIFVTASLFTFFIVGIFYFIFTINFRSVAKPAKGFSNIYYLNKNFKNQDSLITKVPQLKDMINGPIITSNDPMLGSASAPITIVEFSDYNCTFCRGQENILIKILKKYPNQVRLVLKDYPKNDINSFSFKAAIAARCAARQGKFWSYHDMLYKNKQDDINFLSLANKINLDKKSFSTCLQSKKIKQNIQDNILEANALNINGVPFIYVNDKSIMGQISFEGLDKIIQKELNKNIK